MDNGIFEETEMGTPQGGVISPLLANIALDGMIRDVMDHFPQSKVLEDGKRIYRYQPRIIRYADDFVVIHERLEVILECKQLINQWLAKAGLTLKPEKTRVCHTLNNIKIEGETVKAGFDFLGFNIRQYNVGKYRTGTKSNGENLGFKTLIKPSDKSIKRHHEAIKEQIEKFKNSSQAAMIRALNPIIRGWSNYYATVCSKEIFKREDYELWRMLRAAISRKTGKASFNKLRKYFSDGRYGKWTFQTEEGYLQYHSETPIKRHTLVKGGRSPFDGDWVYWSNRKGSYTGTPTRVSKLIKMQKGRCKHCGQYFKPDDLVEIDHVIPRNQGGKDEYKNLQLLHRHCHDEKTQLDRESFPV
jgi:RNA-directed DNA polymerase